MLRTFCLIIATAAVGSGCGVSEPSNGSTDSEGSGEGDSGRPAVALPADLPGDVPIYPGSKPVYVASTEGGTWDSAATSIQMETTDAVETVKDYFAKAMEENSWTGPFPLLGKKGERNLMVNVVEIPARPGTVHISIIYNRPDADADST